MLLILKGLLSAFILLTIYFTVTSLISGWNFALEQFLKYWYFILSLSIGFGIQVSLYLYLKNKIKQNGSKGVLAISGTTSTAAMISCCSHYLANILPILGTVGIVTIVAQYQTQIFWVGLGFNLIGVLYVLNRIMRIRSTYEK